MRELNAVETEIVSGGRGEKIPFSNHYIRNPGPNWPGGWGGAITALPIAWGIGNMVGEYLNRRIAEEYGLTTGEAAYYTFRKF